MKIDTREISIGEVIPVCFDELIDLPSGYKLASDQIKIRLEGKLTRLEDFYYLDAVTSTTLEYDCDVCLEHGTLDLSFDVNERFSSEPSDDDEVILFEDKIIDLGQAVIINLAINFPMKMICSDDCKGLCPRCGKNLNIGDCDCKNGLIDPRFAALNSLFENKEV